MSFSTKLKKLREQEGLTQKTFAEKIGVSAPTVVSYEQGKKTPSFETLNKIADTFHVSLDWLCDKPVRLNNWSDILQQVYAIFTNKYLPVITIRVHAQHEDYTSSSIVFPGYLCANYSTAEHADEKTMYYIESSKNQSIAFENPIYKFTKGLIQMTRLLESGEIDEEIFDLWRDKMFENYDTPIHDHLYEVMDEELEELLNKEDDNGTN